MTSISPTSSDNHEQNDEQRAARVNHSADGERLGAAIYLSADDLAELGADADVETVEYAVVDGDLVLDTAGEGDDR